MKKTSRLLAGPIAALAIGWLLHAAAGLAAPACWTAAITAWCAAWWILEPIPIPATALIPFAAFPLTGVLTHGEAAASYGHSLILLFMGGFMLSRAMEHSGAHRRLALWMVRAVGGSGGPRLVLGFMTASALLSMWITNTATVLMLLPMVLAVIKQEEGRHLSTPLLLGVAYGASIGGLGTPVGSPPNGIFLSVYGEVTGIDLGFAGWMRAAFPVTVLFLPLAWLWLCRRHRESRPIDLPEPGSVLPAERRVLLVFGLTALLWMTRQGPFGGWSRWLGEGAAVHDATVALAMVVVCFLVPDGRRGRLLNWKTAVDIPWGVLLLFGGGIAIARGFVASGLSDALGELLSGLASWPPALMIVVLCLSVSFLTEVTSNTATASVLMPLLAVAGGAAGIDPMLLMLPAALSASCAFMLPVATPPNAIVFGDGRIPIRRMMREGFALNLIGAGVISLVALLVLR